MKKMLVLTALVLVAACGEKKADAPAADSAAMAPAPAPAPAPAMADSTHKADSTMARDTTKKP